MLNVPSSVIFALLALAWLLVFVPLVARRRERVPQAEADSAAFRVLRRVTPRRRPVLSRTVAGSGPRGGEGLADDEAADDEYVDDYADDYAGEDGYADDEAADESAGDVGEFADARAADNPTDDLTEELVDRDDADRYAGAGRFSHRDERSGSHPVDAPTERSGYFDHRAQDDDEQDDAGYAEADFAGRARAGRDRDGAEFDRDFDTDDETDFYGDDDPIDFDERGSRWSRLKDRLSRRVDRSVDEPVRAGSRGAPEEAPQEAPQRELVSAMAGSAAGRVGTRVPDYPDVDEERLRPIPHRPGRGGYDPDHAELTRRYRFRRRRAVVLGLVLLTAALVAGGLEVRPVLWAGAGLAGLLLIGYLVYLRRTVRIEADIRRRRAQRLARARQIRPEFHGAGIGGSRPYASSTPEYGDPTAPSHGGPGYGAGYRADEGGSRYAASGQLPPAAYRRGREVVDLDDDDPSFDELERYRPVTYRRAVGE